MRVLPSISILLITSLISACGGGASTPPHDVVTYTGSTTLTVGTAANLVPQVSGPATVISWSVSPSLPAGLTLSSTSGVINGTPTAVTATGNYTVMAIYQGGSASATLSIVVNDVAPAISYAQQSVTFAANSPVPALEPSNTGGAAVNWSVSPALPSGLTLSTTTGAISGTPAAAAAQAAYTVTAQNSGGSSTFNLTISIGTLVLDLGHQQPIQLLRMTTSRLVSFDTAKQWVLWDYTAGKKIASGVASCRPSGCTHQIPPPPMEEPFIDLEGTTLAVETAAGLEVHSSADGSLSTVIATPVEWWTIATDGSYVCAGSSTTLTVWSPSGTVIASRSGDYSAALVFAAPGEVQIALGPAGASVIETVALPSGTSTVSPAFQGQFSSWFLDGQRFLTSTGNTVWIYSNAAVQQEITSLATIQNLTGQGSWFWNFVQAANQLNVYQVGGSSTPAATYSVGSLTQIVPSGLTVGLVEYGNGAGFVIDLSGSTPASTSFKAPVPYTSTYAAASASQWVVGNDSGVLFDGASIGGTPRYFGYGRAWSIAGSSQNLAIAAASGALLYFDASTLAQEGAINFPATEVALSSDGSVLAAAGDLQDAQYGSAVALNVYSLPSGTQTYTWPYTVGQPPYLQDFTLSGSGADIGQVIYTPANLTSPCARQVTGATGGSVLWADTLGTNQTSSTVCGGTPIRLSPDGTWVAVSQAPPPSDSGVYPATNLYHNGSLVTAVQGWVVGWLDASRILVNNYSSSTAAIDKYTNSTVYDTTGTKIADLPIPVELKSLQVVSASSVYDPGSNAIYSTTTGMATWSGSPSAGVGAVAGSNVVAVYGSQVIAVPD